MAVSIKRRNKEEENWKILFDQIVKGNVIPIIGPEMVKLGETTSMQKIIDVFSEACGIDSGDKESFSQLIYDSKFQIEFEDDDIHSLINNNIQQIVDEYKQDKDNLLLKKFLEIPYFSFVITTVFDPVIENIMREVHGEKLRVLCFRNDPNKNDDLLNEEDTKKPTLYYMFGKADGRSDSFVVTDTDMLKFSRSWMLPSDISSYAKPAILSNILSKRYLLIIGYNYQDWLFRFFWYAMKNDALGKEKGGMLAQSKSDQNLIDFLTRSKAFTQIEPNLSIFVNKLYDGISHAEKEFDGKKTHNDSIPTGGTDVFISYSRGDKEIVQELYRELTKRGLHVWYDKNSLHKGLDFMHQIENAIKRSMFFVPVFTNTIIEQAQEEHPYRLEWKYAVEHIELIGGIPYCFPFLEEYVDVDSIVASIPKQLKKHDAIIFSKNDIAIKAQELADLLCREINCRKNGK